MNIPGFDGAHLHMEVTHLTCVHVKHMFQNGRRFDSFVYTHVPLGERVPEVVINESVNESHGYVKWILSDKERG